ncbi:MAG: galactokinase [Planctomycetota bacterium]|nr:galactokinase [Planctomycetota bacterium]
MEVQPPPSLAAVSIPTEARFAAHHRSFLERFGSGGSPPRLFFAPGRINLMGAHLDYNGGPVMPMAIDRGTFLALRPRTDGLLVLASSREAEGHELHLSELGEASSSGRWWDYPVGVAKALADAGAELGTSGGFDLYFGGDLPVGAGLSSSASITLVTALALDAGLDLQLDVEAAIVAALWAEREYVGVHCGIMDPYAVGFARPGRVLLLDCSDSSWQHLPLDGKRYSVGIVDTGVRRELARGEFNLRVAQCAQAFEALGPAAPGATCLAEVPLEVLEGARLEPVVARRARHVIEETARTFAASAALQRGDVGGFAGEMFAAHHSLRDLFEVSIPELDTIVEVAEAHSGVLGARLTGAGFGGCVAAILEAGSEDDFAEQVRALHVQRHVREPQVAFYQGSPGLGEVGL